MRHQKNTVKLGRKEGHRKSMLSNLACSLIEHSRIKTTLAKAKAVKPMAEKMPHDTCTILLGTFLVASSPAAAI